MNTLLPSKSKDKQNKILIEVGDEILAAIASIADAAQQTLGESSFGLSATALANRSNMMVGVGKPEKFIHAKNASLRDALRRLLLEPCIARVEVEWKNEARPNQTFYLARLSAAGLNGAVRGAHFMTSLDDLGHLAEYDHRGEIATIMVRGRERTARILKRTVLEPRPRMFCRLGRFDLQFRGGSFAIWPTSWPTAPDAEETTTVSPGRGRPTSRRPKSAVSPGMPSHDSELSI